MKKFSKKTILVTIASIVIVIAAILYFAAPAYLYNKAIDGLRKDAGLTIKSVNIPDFKIVYAEGGTGDTIIMLHACCLTSHRLSLPCANHRLSKFPLTLGESLAHV